MAGSDRQELEGKGFRLWRSVEDRSFARHGRTDKEYWHGKDRQFIMIWRDCETGVAFRERWLDVANPWHPWRMGGICHRLDGPAVTKRDRFTGAVIYEAQHVGGKKISECHYPQNESEASRAFRGLPRASAIWPARGTPPQLAAL